MTTAKEKLQNKKDLLKQDFFSAVEIANQSGDFTEVFNIYQQLEKVDRSLDPQKRAAYNRAMAVDLAKSAGSGLALGTSYAASLPNLAFNILDYGANQVARMVGSTAYDPEQKFFQNAEQSMFPTAQEAQRFASENIPFAESALNYQPRSTAGDYVQSIGEFAAPLGLFGKSGQVASVVGGTTFEAAEQFGAGPLTATGVSLAAILTGNYAMNFNRASTIAEMALKGKTKQEIIVAAELEKKFVQAGIPVTANDLLDGDFLNAVFQETAGKAGVAGQRIETYLGKRPELLDDLVNDLMGQIIKDKNNANRLGFDNLNTMLLETQKRIKQKRSLESQQAGYNIGDKEFLKKGLINDIIAEIDNLSVSGTQNASKLALLKDFKKSLTDSKGNPITNVGELSRVYKIYRDKVNAPLGTTSDTLDDFLRSILVDTKNPGNGLVERLETALKSNKNYNAGNNAFNSLSQEVDDAFSYLEALGKKNKKVSIQKIKDVIFNTDNVNPSDIANIAKILRENVGKGQTNVAGRVLPKVDFEDPFSTFVQLYMKNIYNKTFAPGFSGKLPTNAAYNFNKKMFPNEASKANFIQIIKEIAKEKNVKYKDLLEGWKTFSAMAERTGQKITTQQGQTKFGGIDAEALKINSLMYRVRLAQGIVNYRANRAAITLSKVFTSDESVNALVALARNKKNMKAVNTIVLALTPARLQQAQNPNLRDGAVTKQDFLEYRAIQQNKQQSNN